MFRSSFMLLGSSTRAIKLTILLFVLFTETVKSVDSIYEEFRLLNASIINSSQIDHAFENIINVIFYTVVVTVTLSQMGL